MYYNRNNYYKYKLPVKHIRVETSNTKEDAYFDVYSVKELDDEYITTNYTREEFDNLEYINFNFSGKTYKITKMSPREDGSVEVYTQSSCNGNWFGLCNGNIVYVMKNIGINK